ncbi:hypothetical protein [Rhizobium ruizarguesonis]|nr:hypothetical protein [Rhizobium ruizarguesonis]
MTEKQPQSEASKKASNAAFKRFAVTLTELHTAQQEKAPEKDAKKPKGSK